MFENLFKKDRPLPENEPPAAGQAPVPAPDAAGAHAGAAPDANEQQAWRDRIAAAQADDAALLQLAHDAPGIELKLAAINALTHEDGLKRAMREFRDHDKRLYRAAKTHWQEASGRRETLAEAHALIAAARSLLGEDRVPANRVVELDRDWAALNAAWLGEELPAEFSALRVELGSKVRARGEGEQAAVRWLAAVDQALERLRASLNPVAEGEMPPGEASGLAAGVLELLADVQDADDARCIEKTDAANRALALASSVVQRAEFLQSLPAPGTADEAGEKAKIEEWRAFPEVGATDLQSVLALRFADWRNASTHVRQHDDEAHRAHEREATAERKRERAGALQRDVESAEAALAAGNVAELTRLITALDHALKGGPANAGLMQRIKTLRSEQSRLRGWQRWGDAQRREELVAEAQALATAAAGKVAVKTHADAIDKLRERWKDLDKLGGATNQALWLAFDAALKAAYAPVAAHLDKLKAARTENLEARNRIVESLVAAAAKFFPPAQEGAAETATRPDWRAVARTLEEAQTAWRKLGPVEHTVPRKAQRGDDAVTARYARATGALEAPLEAAYREATGQREALIAAATGLAGAGAEARDTIDKVRKLQAQWQANAKSLTLPRREENRLWTAFKAATDAVFTERDAARAAKENQFSAQIKAREEIIARLAELPAAGTAQDIKRAMSEADAAWRGAAEIAKPHAARLEAKYRAARDAATKRLAALAVHASQARFDALFAAMALCDEREAASDEGREPAGAPAETIEARWNAIENLPAAWKKALDARFGAAAGATASRDDLGDTLLRLEVALGIDSPGEFAAARQHLKLRALKDAMEGRKPAATTAADIERWLLDAATTPRPDEAARSRLAKIIAAMRLRRPA